MTARSAPTPSSARRRRRGGPRPRHRKGAGDDHRLHPALLLRRPLRRRQAGHRRSLSQPVRGRRDGRWRSPTASTSATPSGPRSWPRSSAACEGMSEACRALDFPIVSGNVSLYNESKATGGGSAILPTPAIGAVGLLDDWAKSATIAFKAEGERHLSSSVDSRPAMSASRCGCEMSRPQRRRRRRRSTRRRATASANSFVRLIAEGAVTRRPRHFRRRRAGCGRRNGAGGRHRSGDRPSANGFPTPPRSCSAKIRASFVVTVTRWLSSLARQRPRELFAIVIGSTVGRVIELAFVGGRKPSIPLADLRAAHEGFFPELMGADAALA